MKIVFIGALDFGFQCLEAIIESGEEVVGVFTLSQKHKERSGFRDFNELANNVPIFYLDEPKKIPIKEIQNLNPDLILVIGWSWIIPDEILSIPKKGTIGHHPTLLPEGRGNAPIPWTLIKGLTITGVTFFYLESKLDSGKIAAQKEVKVEFEDDASTLYSKLTEATIELMKEMLLQIRNNTLVPHVQDISKATVWPKRKPEDGKINWNNKSIEIYNLIRALTHPYPGAFTFLGDKKLFIWKAKISEQKGLAGQIISTNKNIVIATSDGAIVVETLSFQNEGELDAKDFIKKYNLNTGPVLL